MVAKINPGKVINANDQNKTQQHFEGIPFHENLSAVLNISGSVHKIEILNDFNLFYQIKL